MNDFSGIIHILIAGAFAFFFGKPLGLPLTPLYLAGLALGSLLPDIDHPQATINQKILPIHSGFVKLLVYGGAGWMFISVLATKNIAFALMGVFLILSGFSGHRGFTHKIYGLVLFTAAAYLLANAYGYKPAFYGLVIGYWLHVGADTIKSRLSL